MENNLFNKIKEINYWDKLPSSDTYYRHTYLNVILECLDTHLIKVLVGQRRCGKSTILKQLIGYLIKKHHVSAVNILYLNFELHQLSSINKYEHLIDVIEAYFNHFNPNGKAYIFLDEIQEVESWEKVINSFSANDSYNIEFILTGSNAHLLSTELSTYITGRYIEIPVFPFSFYEYCEYFNTNQNKQELINYLITSGIPELFLLKNDAQKISYLGSLKDSILIHDIVKRFNIKNPKLLSLLLDFLIDNTGKLFSINAIAKKLKSCNIDVNIITLSNYIHYLELTFIIRCARRFDLKGKKILEGERKYYLNDLGFYNYLNASFENNITRKLENYVYTSLLHAGYTVYVGNIYQLEIDFVAEKNQRTIYVQVTYLLVGDEVLKREYGNLEKIKDNWPKCVVSLDDISFPIKKGIEHVQAWQFYSWLQNIF